MGKIVNTYRGYTASQLKSRSSIPEQLDIVVNTSSIDCSNIKLSVVCNLLGVSGKNLSAAVQASSINNYSGFGPVYWILEGGILVPKKLTSTFSLGSFAGYNHNAPVPYKENVTPSISLPYPAGGSATINCTVKVGEVDWTTALIAGVNGVGMEIKQGASSKGSTYLTYSDSYHQNGFSLSVNVTLSLFTDLTGRLYFTKDGDEVCPIPNVSDFNVDIIQLIPSYIGSITMSSALQSVYPTGVLYYDSASLNTTVDTYSINSLRISTSEPNDGDVNRFNMDLFARKNGGTWLQVVDGFFLQTTGYNITNDALPFTIEVYGDYVEFELRDGL